MSFHSIDGTDAFWVMDLDHADTGAGVVRSAPKVLRDGAALLARSVTYGFATLNQQVSGASAAVNAKPEVRAEAMRAFTDAITPATEQKRLLLTAGKGVDEATLAPLRLVDPRPASFWDQRHQAAATSAVASASAALGGLEGRSIAIEHLDGTGVELCALATEQGARVTTIATAAGAVSRPDGFDPTELAQAFSEHGPATPAALSTDEPTPAAGTLAAEVDVLAVGSKAGVIDHVVAAQVAATLVLPVGPVPVTARGLAVLRKADVTVLADFVCLAGALSAMALGESSTAPGLDDVAAHSTAVTLELSTHPEGMLLGACGLAETYLQTWCDELPFGRPLA